MKIRFCCPQCETGGAVDLAQRHDWTCPRCDHLLTLHEPALQTEAAGTQVQTCAVCGTHELYRKKAFPHWLGLSLLTFACLAFLLLNYYRRQEWAWAILLGSALVDGLLYLTVRDVVVCYRCDAEHHGLKQASNPPFELTIHERHRQQKIREAELSSKEK